VGGCLAQRHRPGAGVPVGADEATEPVEQCGVLSAPLCDRDRVTFGMTAWTGRVRQHNSWSVNRVSMAADRDPIERQAFIPAVETSAADSLGT
jgi:hypothetical protein